MSLPWSDRLRALAAPALVWLLAGLLLLALDGVVDLANQALLLVLASALAALWLSPPASVALCVLAVLAFNWLFVPPRYTFSVDLRQHALLLLTTLLVGSLVALLMARQRRLMAREQGLQRQAEQLHAWAEALRDQADPADHAPRLQAQLARLCGAPVALLLAGAGAGAATTLLGEADETTRDALAHALRSGQPMGPGSGRYDSHPAWVLPLRGRHGSFGAAQVPLPAAGDARQRAHAQALCDQMGLALERAQALRQAAAARDEAQAQGLRNTLLAAIAHDHRTPLATILGAASALQTQHDRLDAAQRRQLADRIADEARALARLTDNTLQLARLDAPAVQLRCDWESVEELVGTALRHARLRHAGERLRATLPPGLPLLWCDAVLLGQLLDNLVDNALGYSAAPAPVDLVVRQDGAWLTLSVRDRGPGVPEAWRGPVFQRFQRGPGLAQAPARQGAGLGLALCRAIAQVHGGDLRLAPREGGGSCVDCRLPLGDGPAGPPPEGPRP